MYRQASQGTLKIRQKDGKSGKCFKIGSPFGFNYAFLFLFAEGRSLPMERRHQVLENGTLIINKVTRKDKGLYSCTATNRQGNSASQSGQLKVIGEFFPLELFLRESQQCNDINNHLFAVLGAKKKPALLGPYSELIMVLSTYRVSQQVCEGSEHRLQKSLYFAPKNCFFSLFL